MEGEAGSGRGGGRGADAGRDGRMEGGRARAALTATHLPAGRVKEGREEKKKGEREKEVKCFRV